MRFTKSEMKRSIMLNPGWTKLKLVKFEEKPAKKGNSFNNIFHFENIDEDEPRFDGVPVDLLFNDTMKGPLIKLAKAFGAEMDEEEDNDFEFGDVELGTIVQADIFQSEFNKVTKNDASDFAHIDEDVD